jgi:hypothetical protein
MYGPDHNHSCHSARPSLVWQMAIDPLVPQTLQGTGGQHRTRRLSTGLFLESIHGLEAINVSAAKVQGSHECITLARKFLPL